MAVPIQVTPISQFDPHGEASSTSQRWEKWCKGFARFAAAAGVTDDGQKHMLFLHSAGPEVQDVFDTLQEDGEQTYANALRMLTEYFTPMRNSAYSRHVFRKEKQKEGETVGQYITRLRTLIKVCDYRDDQIHEFIRDQVVEGCKSHRLRTKLLARRQLTLDNVIDMATAMEASEHEASQMDGDRSDKAFTISHQNRGGYRGRGRARGRGHQVNSRVLKCWGCGKAYPHDGGESSCPAFNEECHKCHRTGHFQKFCKVEQTSHGQSRGRWRGRGHGHGRGRVHEVSSDTRENNPDNSSEDYDYVFSVENEVHTIGGESKGVPPKFKITFPTNIEIVMTADSAATCSLIDEKTYNNNLSHVSLEGVRTGIKAYGGTQIQTKGYFHETVSCKGKSVREVFFVVRGHSGCLLSVKASKALKLIKVADHVCNAVNADMYPSVFEGVGKLKDIEIDLHINESVPPVASRHRRIPFHQREKVQKEIQYLLDNDIIERAEGPTPWVSNIVVVPKPKRPGEVRICVDMREPNRAVMRERHPSPVIDDLVERLDGAKVFSRIDLRSGYHQLLLSERSRYITTFSTHIGLFRYKRLNFGICSASEVFQKTIEDVLSGIDGVFNISDDIFIFGKGEDAYKAHDVALDQVLHRLQEKGLTANRSKCEFRKPEMEFFGMMFSGSGTSPDEKKVEALVKLSAPTSVSEVQSLLGMTNYLARFIPGYSTITAPIRKLTVKTQEFEWGSEQESAFKKLKSILSSSPVVSFFDVSKETELIVDASPVGLGAMLVQYDKKRNPSVVAYGSRALTSVEMRYKSQLEREALAVVWACEYFHVYILGAPVKIITDHQPLVTLYGNPSAKLPLRLERWGMRLLPYQPVVEYRRGKDNPSDYMSRHPIESEESSREILVAEEYVNFIAAERIPKAMTVSEVIDATNVDATLCAVKDLLLTDRWAMMETKYASDPSVDYEALQAYSKVGNQLTVAEDGLVLKGHKIAIPEKLQKHVVQLAHEGHQGLVKTKALIREKVWFPRIERLVEETLNQCIACKSSYDPKTREPLIMTELPTRKWSCLAADFYGPLPSGDYLLVVLDEYSRFPEVEVIRSLSARTVIPVFDKIFASRGTPDKLKTDNGTPFQSEEFKKFADHLGFIHRKITPYWPEANGTVERFMRNIGKVCKCAQVEGKPWLQELYRFLRNYRATPHSSTGVPPATVLNGQSLKIKLPQVTHTENDAVIRNRDIAAKAKMKAYAENRRNIKPSNVCVGDRVLMKNTTQHGKMVPKFQPKPFEVVQKKGSMIVAQRGHELKARNSCHFQKVTTSVNPLIEPMNPAFLDIDAEPPMDATFNLVPTPPSTPRAQQNPVIRENPSPKPQVHSPLSRPQRSRTTPKHLKDFEVKLPSFGK